MGGSILIFESIISRIISVFFARDSRMRCFGSFGMIFIFIDTRFVGYIYFLSKYQYSACIVTLLNSSVSPVPRNF